MNNKTAITTFGCFGFAIFLVIYFIVNALFSGIIIVNYWNWFVIPVFDLPEFPNYAYAIGLGLLLSYVCKYRPLKTEYNSKTISDAIVLLLTPLVTDVWVLFFGWIIYQLV